MFAGVTQANRLRPADGPFANPEPQLYREMARYLEERGLAPPDLTAARSLDDVLRACNATYLTRGLESLRSLGDASIDFIFSNSVLQHVRRHELPETLDQPTRGMPGAEPPCYSRSGVSA